MPGRPTRAVTRTGHVAPAFAANGDDTTPSGIREREETAALFNECYAQLRSLAGGYFRRSRDRNDTLQPTALVHELYVRMVRSSGAAFRDREHFLATAASAMRQILVDRERRRRASKRGGHAIRVTIDHDLDAARKGAHEAIVDLLALDTALRALAEVNRRRAQIVEMLYFGGLTVDETAGVLEVSVSLAEKEWRLARAWLRRELASAAE